METFVIILADFGLPIAGSFAMGVFIYIILRYILGSVIGQVQTMHAIITQLDNRVRNINNDVIKLGLLISHTLDVPPDEERIARADGKKDEDETNGLCSNITRLWFPNGRCCSDGILHLLYIHIYYYRNKGEIR